MKKEEFCIMLPSELYYIQRFPGSERHEVFGASNRNKSIEDGLVIFLTPKDHRDNKVGIHADKEFRLKVQKIAQEIWMQYYNKTEDEFRKRYGRSYL